MKKLLAILFILGAFSAVYIYKDELGAAARKELLEPVSLEVGSLLEHENAFPEPLRFTESTQSAYLTAAGTVNLTNQERVKAGQQPLKVNAKLAAAAKAKLDDMFAKQYFEHESPDDRGPADLAKTAGYSYVLVGENLALGNFKNDAALVEGWMNSPGHRENILNGKYQEIGVAVGQGMYEGRKTWMAVQEFGTPLSSCPSVDKDLKAQIELNEVLIHELEAEANQKRDELEKDKKSDPTTYNNKVDEYNALVRRINQLVEETKTMVAEYNKQVNAFNSCISS